MRPLGPGAARHAAAPRPRGLVGSRAPNPGDLGLLASAGSLDRLKVIYSGDGQTLEARELMVVGDRVRFFVGGAMLPDMPEIVARLESMANEATVRAEEAARRAEDLARRVAELEAALEAKKRER